MDLDQHILKRVPCYVTGLPLNQGSVAFAGNCWAEQDYTGVFTAGLLRALTV